MFLKNRIVRLVDCKKSSDHQSQKAKVTDNWLQSIISANTSGQWRARADCADVQAGWAFTVCIGSEGSFCMLILYKTLK